MYRSGKNRQWKMVIKGKVDENYTGTGSNNFGTWYIKNGQVMFDYTGIYTEGNTVYTVEEGKIIYTSTKDTTGVIKINDIWRMVINGVQD